MKKIGEKEAALRALRTQKEIATETAVSPSVPDSKRGPGRPPSKKPPKISALINQIIATDRPLTETAVAHYLKHRAQSRKSAKMARKRKTASA